MVNVFFFFILYALAASALPGSCLVSLFLHSPCIVLFSAFRWQWNSISTSTKKSCSNVIHMCNHHMISLSLSCCRERQVYLMCAYDFIIYLVCVRSLAIDDVQKLSSVFAFFFVFLHFSLSVSVRFRVFQFFFISAFVVMIQAKILNWWEIMNEINLHWMHTMMHFFRLCAHFVILQLILSSFTYFGFSVECLNNFDCFSFSLIFSSGLRWYLH